MCRTLFNRTRKIVTCYMKCWACGDAIHSSTGSKLPNMIGIIKLVIINVSSRTFHIKISICCQLIWGLGVDCVTARQWLTITPHAQTKEAMTSSASQCNRLNYCVLRLFLHWLYCYLSFYHPWFSFMYRHYKLIMSTKLYFTPMFEVSL